MERAFKKGCHVVYFDEHRQAHDAIVTNWFHGGPDGQTVAELQKRHEENVAKGLTRPSDQLWMPCCNVVFVTSDKAKQDPYGDQIERSSSTTYGRQTGMTPFIGRCWCWPDEVEEAKELAAKAYAEAVAR